MAGRESTAGGRTMQLTQALDEMKDLYEKVMGRPVADWEARRFVPFPPGVDPLAHALQEFEAVKGLEARTAYAPKTDAWLPAADSFLTKDGFFIRMEIPGISREDLKVFTLGGECVVRGDRKPPHCVDEARPISIERPWGQFERRFVLPVGSRIDALKARFADGLLELRIPVEGIETPNEKTVEVA
jgi:HSP20 family protein